ncbi:phosphate ABC transporter permease PstA [Candidatus Albibeggiatoa sp. nov. BB20]|uniref:phosphate ABC transporter permease PstA n=1 Tax=Candidatus Albibeggiatoa sp. nov. BB20 TaxID=3162723 RepID=UPI00336561D9
MKDWWKSGDPWIWLTASAVSISIIVVVGLLSLIAVRGLGHFWPSAVVQANYVNDGETTRLIGEIRSEEVLPASRLRAAGEKDIEGEWVTRYLFKTGNRDLVGLDFRPVLEDKLQDMTYPENIMVVERHEWGNFYGYLKSVKENGQVIAEGDAAKAAFVEHLARSSELHHQISRIEKHKIGKINYALERLRLYERRLELDGRQDDPEEQVYLAEKRSEYDIQYQALRKELAVLYQDIKRDSFTAEVMDGKIVEIAFSKVVYAYWPNALSLGGKIGHYGWKAWEFVSDEPREANTEGGIFPAIFGTVMMVFIMSIIVTPFGVVAAVYLREYAKQGFMTRAIRVAVNNLAGVPSIVYGVFGLGFFVYLVGGTIDQVFFPEALPAPTFGTGGIIWASLTLAILTVPVVIVSTEEGLTRIPRSIREGSLALGATKAETLWRTVLPMASPAMMTGLILAIARAAGEVAPLMLVGVVKLAPSLVVDANYPFAHLDRKFMHLGFHIYDVGFQSPNVEAARPLVYATAFLLVAVIILLNISAIWIRNHLREQYKSLETM